jgi:hypothetical protein
LGKEKEGEDKRGKQKNVRGKLSTVVVEKSVEK